MKNQLRTLLVVLFLPFISHGQEEPETVVFNGQTFYQLSGKYYILDNPSQELIPVSSKIISLKYSSIINENQIEDFETQYNLSFLRKAETGWYDYILNASEDVFIQCQLIQSSLGVELVEVCAAAKMNKVPNDSAAYNNPVQTWHGWQIPKTGLDKAWDKTTGSPSIVIALLDTGIDWWHEDFAQATGTAGTFWLNKLENDWSDPNDPSSGNNTDDDGNGLIDDWRGWNFLSNTNDVRDEPNFNNHGTFTGGYLAARSNNYNGIAGVAGGWGCTDGIKLMNIKAGGSADTITAQIFDDALLYAAKNGAQIIVTTVSLYSNHAAIDAAIEYVYNNYNCVVLCSSGNNMNSNTQPVWYPASHPLVLSVAMTSSADRVRDSHVGVNLELAAPGWYVPTTARNNQYQVQAGTSLAAPFAAGVAGLMLSINPCLNNEEVGNILKRRAAQVHKNSTNPYNYHYDQTKPGHSLTAGYGRVNAQAAVNTAEAMKKSTTLDLYIKDHYNDFGYPQSYPDTTFYSDWSDIWVRNQPDGHTNRTMDEIKYTQGKDVYVYVRVRNKSCVTSSNADRLKVYWTKFSSSSSWSAYWDGTLPNFGNNIADVAIPPLAAGEDTILEFPWTIIADTAHWGRCIMGRIVSSADPITPYGDLGQEIRYNNNIAIRNLTVIHTKSGQVGPVVNGIQYPDGVFGYIGLPGDGNNTPVDIHFDVPYEYNGPTIIEDSEVRVFLSDELWNLFSALQTTDYEGLEIAGDKELLITSNHARIRNLLFENNQRCSLYVGFNFLTDEVDSDTYIYRYHLTQYRNEVLDGGMHFTIDRTDREDFDADAGPDQFIYEGQSAQMNASDINEPAIYNWYDSNDSLVYSGKSPNLSPTITEKYKLEVIANADLYKDYDEVEIKVNPYAINTLNPNPATSNLTIGYDADEASSAYIMIYPTVGSMVGNSYIISTSQKQTNINVSNYPPGVYTVILVCDGTIADTKMLTIQ